MFQVEHHKRMSIQIKEDGGNSKSYISLRVFHFNSLL